jgi:hypothetical protein
MFRAILELFPPDLDVDDALATVLQVSDRDMSRLLGISLCHSSFLNQTGHGEWAAALRLLELFGYPLLRMAVAHTIHISGTVTTAGEASRETADAIEPLQQKLIIALHVRELARFGRSVSCDPSLPSQGMLQSLANQVIGAFTICLGYSELLRFIEPYCEFHGRPETASRDFKTALQEYSQRRWGPVQNIHW